MATKCPRAEKIKEEKTKEVNKGTRTGDEATRRVEERGGDKVTAGGAPPLGVEQLDARHGVEEVDVVVRHDHLTKNIIVFCQFT